MHITTSVIISQPRDAVSSNGRKANLSIRSAYHILFLFQSAMIWWIAYNAGIISAPGLRFNSIFRVRLAMWLSVGEKRVILLHTVEEVRYVKV